MRNKVSSLTAALVLALAGTASASDEPSYLRYEECLFQANLYGMIVKSLRDRGHDIAFSEVERSGRLGEVLIQYGISKYGQAKALEAARDIGGGSYLTRAGAYGNLLRDKGFDDGLAILENLFRECEVIWEDEL